MKYLVIAAPLALLASTAFAADPGVPMDYAPVASWAGGYAGIQAGVGFGSTGTLQLSPFAGGLPAAFAPGFSGQFNSNFVGGVHAGYDWQSGSIVYGGLLDISYANLSDQQVGRSITPATYTITRRIDVLATARARLGYAASDRFLPYITGGLAYGNVNFGYTQPGSGAAFTTSGGQFSNFGYTVGAGFETKVTQKLSFGLEYLYTNLGGNNFRANLVNGPFGAAGGPGTNLTGSDNNFDFHTITAKLSYRF